MTCCPFSRDCQPGLPDDEHPYDFIVRHFDEYRIYTCPKSGDPCEGQKIFAARIANYQALSNADLLALIDDRDPDTLTYLDGCNEFIRHHRGDMTFALKPPEPEQKPEQGELF